MTEEEFRAFLIEQNATPERIEKLVGQVSPDVIRKFAKDFGQVALDNTAIEAFASALRKDFSQRVLLARGKGTLEDFWDTHTPLSGSAQEE